MAFVGTLVTDPKAEPDEANDRAGGARVSGTGHRIPPGFDGRGVALGGASTLSVSRVTVLVVAVVALYDMTTNCFKRTGIDT